MGRSEGPNTKQCFWLLQPQQRSGPPSGGLWHVGSVTVKKQRLLKPHDFPTYWKKSEWHIVALSLLLTIQLKGLHLKNGFTGLRERSLRKTTSGKKSVFALSKIHEQSLKDNIQNKGMELLKFYPMGSCLCWSLQLLGPGWYETNGLNLAANLAVLEAKACWPCVPL